jgi:hypothetical protein
MNQKMEPDGDDLRLLFCFNNIKPGATAMNSGCSRLKLLPISYYIILLNKTTCCDNQ